MCDKHLLYQFFCVFNIIIKIRLFIDNITNKKFEKTTVKKCSTHLIDTTIMEKAIDDFLNQIDYKKLKYDIKGTIRHIQYNCKHNTSLKKLRNITLDDNHEYSMCMSNYMLFTHNKDLRPNNGKFYDDI